MVFSRSKRKGRALFCFILFLIIFNPPLSRRISFTVLFSVFSAGYLAAHFGQTKKLLRRLKKPFRIAGLLYLYYLLICLANAVTRGEFRGTIMMDYVRSVFYFICQMSISLFVVLLAKRMSISSPDVIRMFIYAGLAQAALGVLCFLLPPVKNTLNSLMIRNAEAGFASVVRANSSRRNYGFASTLFDVFGLTMSLLSMLAFCQALTEKNRKYYLYFVLLSIAAVLNARTSIVLIGTGVILAILIYRAKRMDLQKTAKKAALFLALIAAAAVVLRRIEQSSSETAAWLSDGIGQIRAFFQGEQTGIFASMSEDFIFFPNSFIATLFGTSLSPMELVNRNTDMGYIQSIWRYGVIGSVLLYAFWFSLCRGAYRRRQNQKERIIIISFSVLLFVYQIKLNTWGYSMAGAVYYPVFMLFASRNKTDLL